MEVPVMVVLKDKIYMNNLNSIAKTCDGYEILRPLKPLVPLY